MNTKLISMFTFLFAINMAFGAEVEISKRPEWQQPILEKVSFNAEVIGMDQIRKDEVPVSGGKWVGFVLFTCTAKENLGKRILWISAEVTFSNGMKRKFDDVSFFILQEGSQFDIEKIMYDTDKPITVKSVLITSVTMK